MDIQADTGATLFALNAAVDARLRARAARPPQELLAPAHWTGMLFRVRDRLLLASLDQIVEVLGLPDAVTPLPGTKEWVMGIANNRGGLLPIFDLDALLHGGPPRVRDTDRVLVVRHADLTCGLVATEVIGIRHLAITLRLADPPAGLGVLEPFAQGAYALAGEAVPVIALDRLLASPLLCVVAA